MAFEPVADQLEITNCYLLHPNLTSFDSLTCVMRMMNSAENWNSMGFLSYALPFPLSLFFPFPNVLVQLVLPDVVFWSLRPWSGWQHADKNEGHGMTWRLYETVQQCSAVTVHESMNSTSLPPSG